MYVEPSSPARNALTTLRPARPERAASLCSRGPDEDLNQDTPNMQSLYVISAESHMISVLSEADQRALLWQFVPCYRRPTESVITINLVASQVTNDGVLAVVCLLPCILESQLRMVGHI